MLHARKLYLRVLSYEQYFVPHGYFQHEHTRSYTLANEVANSLLQLIFGQLCSHELPVSVCDQVQNISLEKQDNQNKRVTNPFEILPNILVGRFSLLLPIKVPIGIGIRLQN